MNHQVTIWAAYLKVKISTKKDDKARSEKVKLTCAVETTLKVIGGRWKFLILRELMLGVKRFGELHKALQGVTQKMSTAQLRELEEDSITHRQIYNFRQKLSIF